MLHKLFSPALFEFVQVPLQVGARHLASCPDSACYHFLRNTAGLELKQMWSFGINTCNEQADTIWALAVLLGICLRAVTDALGYFCQRDCAVVCQTGGE